MEAEKASANDDDVKEKDQKHPKSIPFILLNILLERFSAKGISSVKRL